MLKTVSMNPDERWRQPMVFGSNKILVIGEKETFIIKVLMGKLKDAGITAVFSSTNVNAIIKSGQIVALSSITWRRVSILQEKLPRSFVTSCQIITSSLRL